MSRADRQIPPNRRPTSAHTSSRPPRSSRPDVDAAVGKLERKAIALDRAATKAEKMAAKLAAKASRIDEVSARLASLDLWMRPEPGSRKPRFSRDDIAAAALRIADAEGFEALSMRRLATDLGSGTMTLYHYVRTKDELLALLHDAVMGELLIPDADLPTQWRRALMMIADRSRASWQRHPWALDIHIDPAPGPNGAKHFEQSLQAVSTYPGTFAERVELITAVDEYVLGYSSFIRTNAPAVTTADGDMLAYMNGLLASGDYPMLEALRDERGLTGLLRELEGALSDDGRFERNLNRLLDGFDR